MTNRISQHQQHGSSSTCIPMIKATPITLIIINLDTNDQINKTNKNVTKDGDKQQN